MATAWFLTDYYLKIRGMGPGRICRMNEYTPMIEADGGQWGEVEVLGGYAVCKVAASLATLETIKSDAHFQYMPVALLTSPLAELTVAQRQAILDRLEAMGYTLDEIKAALGNNIQVFRSKTLADVLRFAASRRRKPRFDAVAGQFVYDGEVFGCEAIETADLAVTED